MVRKLFELLGLVILLGVALMAVLGAVDPAIGAVPAYALPSVPGVINPAVTQANIGSTICVAGWTKKVRPPASYTDKLKAQLMVSQHLAGSVSEYELDHKISIEDGGHPSDPNNLWMQPYAGQWGARTKDRLETLLKRLVCSGTVPLAEAQRELATDWIAAFQARIGDSPVVGGKKP